MGTRLALLFVKLIGWVCCRRNRPMCNVRYELEMKDRRGKA